MKRTAILFVLVLAVSAGSSPSALAQSIGIGPRLSFVRGDVTAAQSVSARYLGGIFRARTSRKTAIELGLDYRRTTNPSLGQKTRDLPFQTSLLLYPVRSSSIGIYLLGGVGWYNRKVETLTTPSVATSTTKMGYHAGLGGELALGRRAALHLDYRYTFIHLGDQAAQTGAGGAIPIPGLIGLQEKLKLSHQGSMWTTGVTVYF